MRKIFCLLPVLFFFAAQSFAQNKTDDKGRKQGEWRKNYPNGNLIYKGSFADDEPTGLFLYYYETGNLKAEQNYLGNEVSEMKLYEPDGKKTAATGRYKGKLKDGEWKYYMDNHVTLVETYKDGKKEGISKTYSKSGNLIEETPYKNDKIDGIKKNYLEDGRLYSEISYKDGLRNGPYNLYEGSLFPLISGKYVNDKKDGTWEVRNEKGVIEETLQYANDLLLNEKDLQKKSDSILDAREKNIGKFREPNEELRNN